LLFRERGVVSRVLLLRAWRVGLIALPVQVCYFTVFYLALRTGREFPWPQQVLLLVSLWLYFTYMVLVNDLADRRIDSDAGKATLERGHGLSPGQVALVLAAVVLANAAAVVELNGGIVFDSVWIVIYLLATAYSVPPLSLKRRGVLGFLADSVMEKPLPILIVFSWFGYYGYEVLLFPLVGELMDSVFKHQAEDYDLDVRTRIRTFAVELGKSRSQRIVSGLINPLDVLLVLAGFATVIALLPRASLPASIALGVTVLAFFAALAKVRGRMFHPTGPGWPVPPYVALFNAGFQVLLTSLLGLLAASADAQYIPLLVLFFASLSPYLVGYAIISLTRLGLIKGRK